MKFPIISIDILDYLPWHLDASPTVPQENANPTVSLDDPQIYYDAEMVKLLLDFEDHSNNKVS
jgi:hypothetical protein